MYWEFAGLAALIRSLGWHDEFMPLQHVVQFDNSLRLTRLPPGRAEGRIWLHFVLAGLGWNHHDANPGVLRWNLGDHVRVSGENGLLNYLGGGATGDGALNYLQQEWSDDGSSQLTIEYREGEQLLGREMLDLPDHPSEHAND